jgi:hypothetical protein
MTEDLAQVTCSGATPRFARNSSARTRSAETHDSPYCLHRAGLPEQWQSPRAIGAREIADSGSGSSSRRPTACTEEFAARCKPAVAAPLLRQFEQSSRA